MADMTPIDLPDDADGDALRRIAADGSDLSRPMEIDFMVAAPNEHAARAVATVAAEAGYRTDVERDEESGEWTCYCSKTLLATHEAVVAAQEELDRLARPLGGHADGWGTWGNAPE